MKKLSKYVYGLRGDLLPIHLKPNEDELLSSWIIRLAHAHGIRVESFCTILFGSNSNVWNRDIDKSASEKIIQKLVQKTGSTHEQVHNTLLKNYENLLFESLNVKGSNKWIIPLSIYHRTRKKSGLMICPKCLKEDLEPYYRRSWRLSLSTVCTMHKINLIDSCPCCHNPIIPHRVDMQNKLFPNKIIFTLCWCCHFDFNNLTDYEVANSELVALQMKMENIISNGYVHWDNNTSMHSIIFFEGIRALIIGLYSNKSVSRLYKLLNQLNLDVKKTSNHSFESLSLYQRREILRFIAWVLCEWPKQFVNIIHIYNLRYSDLKGDSVDRPNWYEKVLRQECKGAYLPISDEEVKSIVRYVEQVKGKFDLKYARKLSGRDITKKVKDVLPEKVSDQIYENFMMSIDQEIAGTLKRKERLCLIRDKIMFACARILSLNVESLSKLTAIDIEKLMHGDEQLNFYSVAMNPAQIKLWVKWYCRNVRGAILSGDECDYLFVSFNTKNRLKKSIISLRFNRAVAAANMQRVIKSYRCWI